MTTMSHDQSTIRKSTIVRSIPWQIQAIRPLHRALSTLAPGLAGSWAARIFRTPRGFPAPPRELAWLAGAKPFTLCSGGQRLKAWSWGSGPTVLLVHGWEGRGSQMAACAADLVSDGYRVVTFDAPAHGASEGKRSSLPQFGQAVAEIAATVGPIEAVVAHSFGTAATSWALGLGLRVQRLVYIAPPDDIQDYVDRFSQLLGFGRRAQTAMLRWLETRFEIDWAEARVVNLRAAGAAPLLVIHDRDDQDAPFPGGEAVAATWPGAELLATEGLGHRRILRNKRVVGRIRQWVGGTPRLEGSAPVVAGGPVAAPAVGCGV